MIPSRQKRSNTISLLSRAPCADVIMPTGGPTTPHTANNVLWYRDNRLASWLYTAGDMPSSHPRVDTITQADGDLRLCWGVGSWNGNQLQYQDNSLAPGFRCGDNSPNWLVGDQGWERMIFHAD